MTDKKYEETRNKLIPVAEKFANQTVGYGKEKNNEWRRVFLQKMDELVQQNGLLGSSELTSQTPEIKNNKK